MPEITDRLRARIGERVERATHKLKVGRKAVELARSRDDPTVSARVFQEQLSPSERRQAASFELALEAVKPQLFGLAGQLLEARQTRQWNVLIGDDTSARLPVRFVRKVFEGAGGPIDTQFISTSKSTRGVKEEGVFDARAQQMVQGHTEPRALIVTESAGTYNGLEFLHGVMEPHCQTLDTAIVGARVAPPEGMELGEVYIGGQGDDAVKATWNAFENPLRLSTKGRDDIGSEAVTGVTKNADPQSALASVALGGDFPTLPAYCYSRMDELAQEFLDGQGQVDIRS